MDRGDHPFGVHQIRTWQDAEVCAARWMQYWGFTDAVVTAAGPDGGVDVTATGALAQVKFQAVTVGSPDLQRLFGARGHALHRALLFFTGTGYSTRALEYAASAGIALFTYDLTGWVDPANGPARQLVADAEAARTPPPKPERAPKSERRPRKFPDRGGPPAARRTAARPVQPTGPAGPAGPAAIAVGMGCAATALLGMGSLLLSGVTAGVYRPGLTAAIAVFIVLGALCYLAGLAVLLDTAAWGRTHRHQAAAEVAIVIAGVAASAMWVILGRHVDEEGGGHTGAWTVTLMVAALVLTAMLAMSGRAGVTLSPDPPSPGGTDAPTNPLSPRPVQ